MRKGMLRSRRKFRSGREASALIIVLASLAFLAALALAFLASISTELKSSKRYADGVSTQLLAQSAFNLAITQISEGTRGIDAGGNTVAWASQPGMIRTYGVDGSKKDFYRLYSWDVMAGTGAFDPATESALLTGWNTEKALFTDLNQPIKTGGSLLFPIVDGEPDGTLETMTLPVAGAVKTYNTDSVAANPDVEGFYVLNAPLATSGPVNPVPMPVKWLYVLADGEIVAPTAGGNANEAKVAGAGTANPIMGRIAFWTDDETAKININTASDGVYTDMPRSNSTGERTLAANQPVQAEYQRYPGHPAMTSLKSVFPTLTSDQIYGLAPRVRSGGSQAGTVVTTGAATPTVITPDADRLYATVDELMFKPSLVSGVREMNDPAPANPQILNKTMLERSKFFLTASSRSPELNLFNKPRICIWPLALADDSDHRTAFDRLIAFCSTLRSNLPSGGYRYYFQREDATSPTHDLPATASASGLGRNRMLMNYLRTLSGQNIPGFGGNFASKYSATSGGATECDQILTEIFDYVRSTNLADSQIPVAGNRYTFSTNSWGSGRGQVIPIEDASTGTRGFGRFKTVQGGTLLFIANVDGDDASSQVNSNGVALTSASNPPLVAAGQVRMQVMFIPQLFDPSVGSIYNYPNFVMKVEGLDALKCNGTTMFTNASITQTHAYYARDNAYFGDQFGVNQVASTAYINNNRLEVSKSGFTFTGGDVTIKLYASNGTTLLQTVVLRFPDGNFPAPSLTPDLVNNLDYQNNAFGTPCNMRYFKAGPTNVKVGRMDGSSGFNTSTWFAPGDIVRSVCADPGDMRLIAARKNTPLPGTSDYPFAQVNAADWNTATMSGMHTFFSGDGEPLYGTKVGRLVAGAAYDGYGSGVCNINSLSSLGQLFSSSAISIPLNGVAVGKKTSFTAGDLPGDWDNGPFYLRDGPFINKADEGDKSSSGGPYSWRGRDGNSVLSDTLFTPNRQIPSAVTFGSLSTGVLSNRPWQTLLFHPDPTGNHPGVKGRKGDGSALSSAPADHLLLDFFNMPVVEPYAISEPLATAGKINMNYQIIPFTYINRDTGIRAVLKSEKVVSILESQANVYKLGYASASQADIRLNVDANQTLISFNNRFNIDKDLFRSASEICEIPIVPAGATYATLTTTAATNYWNTRRLTGDNSRERPYATIYPRLTTKSNTFTIHTRVQTLKKVPGTAGDVWTEGRDQVTGEYRGQQTIERYIDPKDTGIPDYADPSSPNLAIGTLYKTRVVGTKQFSP